MRVLQLVFTIALLSNQESSGVAALLSPLRERRAKAGKSTNAPTDAPTTPPTKAKASKKMRKY
eukprot:scaffold3774_cov137-Alexandrium_tamarense.AAC.1